MNKGSVSTLPSETEPRRTDLVPDIDRIRAEERARVEEIYGLYYHTPAIWGITLREVIEVVKRRGLFLLIGLAVGAELAMLGLAMLTPLYAVSSQVVITMQTPGQLIDTDSGSSAFIATQAEVIQSPDVVQAAVAGLPSPSFLEPEQDAVAAALDSVHASAISGTRVIALGYLGADPSYGAALLSAMVDVYVAKVRDSTSSGQANVVDTKHEELEALTKELAQQEARIAKLRESNAIIGPADEAVAEQRALIDAQVGKLTDARSRRIELESQLAAGGAVSIDNDPVRRALEEQLRQAQSELAIASVTLTAEHPSYVKARHNVDVLRTQLASSVGGSRGDLQQQLDGARRLEQELAALVEQSRKRLELIESHRREENMIMVEVARMQAQADEWRSELFNQRLVSRLAETGDVGIGAHIIEQPSVPDEPVWPKKKLLLAIGGVLGLLLGFVLGLVSLRKQHRHEVEK